MGRARALLLVLVGLLVAVPARGAKGQKADPAGASCTLECVPPRPPWWRYLPSIQARSDGRITATISLSEIMSVKEKWEAHMQGAIAMAARLHTLHLTMLEMEQRVELGLESPRQLIQMREEARELLYKLRALAKVEPEGPMRAYLRCLVRQYEGKFEDMKEGCNVSP